MREIKEILEYFQEAYTKRDPHLIDEFMTKLFDGGEDLIILGTSLGEACLTKDECRELFLSDWKYWRDVSMDIDNSKIKVIENTAWVFATATLLYSFETNENSYKRYLDYVKNFFSEESNSSILPNKFKLTEINWVLSHFLTPRDKQKREYLWPLRISFVMLKREERWIIKQIQFSLPNSYEFPDCRIDSAGNYLEEYKNEVDKFHGYAKEDILQRKPIVNMLADFKNSYLNRDLAAEELVSKYFYKENPVFINTDSNFNLNKAAIEKQINIHRDSYSEFLLNTEESVININGNTAWAASNGIIKSIISEEKAFDMAARYVKNQFDKNVSDKEKLFNIRRVISATIKETIKGSSYEFPFRFEAVLVKENDAWKFDYVQLSYPFNYILEGKFDYVAEVE
jgi:hypothetical protein